MSALTELLQGAHRLFREEAALVIALFLSAALILGFGLLAAEMLEGELAAFDNVVLSALRSTSDPKRPIGPAWVEEMVRDLTALGSFALLGLLLFATLGWLMIIRKHGTAALMATAVLGGVVISTALKQSFDRPRPDIAGAVRVFTPSFPSGHAMLSAVTFLTIGILLSRASEDVRVRVYFIAVALCLTLIVGLSRIYLGVHYPSDVLGGWCVGSAWAVLCWSVAIRLQRTGAVEPPGPSR